MCQFGAGKGKSRVAAALAFYFMKNSRLPVYIVFANDGLMNRDKDQCKDLWQYAQGVDEKIIGRIHYITDISSIPSNKISVVIVDESDDIMLKNPIGFYNQVKKPGIRVICLTATPDDGYSAGAERNLISLMGFK